MSRPTFLLIGLLVYVAVAFGLRTAYANRVGRFVPGAGKMTH